MTSSTRSAYISRLTDIPIGQEVQITEFCNTLDPLQREQLHAYGLSVKHAIRILQQHPLTVILCDHIEIALEHTVASHLMVETSHTA